jgi:hypothetical protein
MCLLIAPSATYDCDLVLIPAVLESIILYMYYFLVLRLNSNIISTVRSHYTGDTIITDFSLSVHVWPGKDFLSLLSVAEMDISL